MSCNAISFLCIECENFPALSKLYLLSKSQCRIKQTVFWNGWIKQTFSSTMMWLNDPFIKFNQLCWHHNVILLKWPFPPFKFRAVNEPWLSLICMMYQCEIDNVLYLSNVISEFRNTNFVQMSLAAVWSGVADVVARPFVSSTSTIFR